VILKELRKNFAPYEEGREQPSVRSFRESDEEGTLQPPGSVKDLSQNEDYNLSEFPEIDRENPKGTAETSQPAGAGEEWSEDSEFELPFTQSQERIADQEVAEKSDGKSLEEKIKQEYQHPLAGLTTAAAAVPSSLEPNKIREIQPPASKKIIQPEPNRILALLNQKYLAEAIFLTEILGPCRSKKQSFKWSRFH